jgi:hypothetical protein
MSINFYNNSLKRWNESQFNENHTSEDDLKMEKVFRSGMITGGDALQRMKDQCFGTSSPQNDAKAALITCISEFDIKGHSTRLLFQNRAQTKCITLDILDEAFESPSLEISKLSDETGIELKGPVIPVRYTYDNLDKDKNVDKKEKQKKLNHDELLSEIAKIIEDESILENKISELEKTLVLKVKLRSNYRRNKNKYILLLSKAYQDGINKTRKEKKKRTNNSKSGILAEHPIPPILQKFLNLPENTLLMRPKVFSLLNNKFKELGLKKGQETILDKKTAKLFGVDEGYIIRFQDCQKFLADIYEKANIKATEVTL